MPRKTRLAGQPEEVDEVPKQNGNRIPERLAQRLPVYYRILLELSERGVERASSTDLSHRIGVAPAQLRQDLGYFDNCGQQGYVYRIDDLCAALAEILGLDHRYKLVLAGAGHLGKALVNYDGFRRRGYQFVAVFDNAADVIGTRVGVLEVQAAATLSDYLRSHRVDIGVLALPAEAAQKVADTFVEQGVKAIWNFASTRLLVPEDVLVEHQHLSDSLMSLAFRLHTSRSAAP